MYWHQGLLASFEALQQGKRFLELAFACATDRKQTHQYLETVAEASTELDKLWLMDDAKDIYSEGTVSSLIDIVSKFDACRAKLAEAGESNKIDAAMGQVSDVMSAMLRAHVEVDVRPWLVTVGLELSTKSSFSPMPAWFAHKLANMTSVSNKHAQAVWKFNDSMAETSRVMVELKNQTIQPTKLCSSVESWREHSKQMRSMFPSVQDEMATVEAAIIGLSQSFYLKHVKEALNGAAHVLAAMRVKSSTPAEEVQTALRSVGTAAMLATGLTDEELRWKASMTASAASSLIGWADCAAGGDTKTALTKHAQLEHDLQAGTERERANILVVFGMLFMDAVDSEGNLANMTSDEFMSMVEPGLHYVGCAAAF